MHARLISQDAPSSSGRCENLFTFMICFGCPGRHNVSAGVASFGSQINDIVRGLDHVEVMFDHQQRAAGVDQRAETPPVVC